MNNFNENYAGNPADYPSAPGGLRAYWDTICIRNGLRLQKNYYFDHYRILDEYHMKRAQGTEKEMLSMLDTLASQ
jgi:hypothetical protein